MRRRAFIVVLCSVLTTPVLFTQEDTSELDSLFETPPEDIVEAPQADETPIDHTEAFTVQEKLGFSGSFSATGGVGLGWVEYSGLERPLDDLDGSFLATSSLALALDARPDPDLRVHGGFSVSLEPSSGNYSWSSIVIDELFCDYTLGPAFIRFGKHTIAWGQGRLYTPGNLMDGSDAGSALKVSFPTVLSGVSFVTFAQNGYFADPANPSIREFAYGALADAVFGPLRTSLGLRYRKPEGYRGLLSLKMNVLKTDLLCDLVGRRDAEEVLSATSLTGFYREWQNLTLYGEWQRNYTEDAVSDAVGAALSYNNIAGSTVDFGVKWMHSLDPVSGAVAVGVSWDPFKYVKTSVALPIVYGDPGKFDILDDDLKLTQRVALVFLAKISASF